MYPAYNKPTKARFFFVIGLLLILLLALFGRVAHLTIWTQKFLRDQGDARTLRIIDLHAHRGMITDRNGKPLAVSTPVTSVWMDPTQFQASTENINALAEVLTMKPAELAAKVERAQADKREFIYLKRQIPPAMAKDLDKLVINGVYSQQEYRRFYPEGEATAHLLGFTDIDDHGQEGLELAFDHWLRGVAGKKQVIKDRLGRVIANLKTLQSPRAGRNMHLSIDRRIQYLAYEKLREAVTKHQVQSGSVVVLDTANGEVLAMVNYPSFNPNVRQRVSDESMRNRALTDTFEPASLIKPFSIANALLSQQYSPETLVDTNPGWMMINGKMIHDIRNYGNINVETVLTKSSNIGVAKITLSLPPDKLPKLLSEVGFGQTTQSGFPGEVSGKLSLSDSPSSLSLATLSYGYGISVTTLQLAQAYSVFARHGQLQPVSLFRQSTPEAPKQILPSSVADTVLAMLEKTASPHGTARRARLQEYRVGGKTGTSRIVGEQGYDKNRHNAFFAGIAPISDPRLVIAVLLHDPQGEQYYGGQIAAPLFAEVMQDALHLLKVQPDVA